jgi:hypothetical protein
MLPLSGGRSVFATGFLPPIGALSDRKYARSAVRSVLAEHAFLDGHDAHGLLDRTNLALSARGAARIESLALVTQSADDGTATVSTAGRPLPLIVTNDGLCTPIRGTVSIRPGVALVLARTEDPATFGVLSTQDVLAAVRLLDPEPGTAGPPPTCTVLAVRFEG